MTTGGADMKRLISWCAAGALVAVLTGCGNTAELETTITDQRSMIERLETEKKQLETENAALRQRANTLEQEKRMAEQVAAKAEAEANRLRMELEQVKNPPKPADMDGAYNDALETFRVGRYAEAAEKFDRLIKAGIGDPLEDNCHYWMGESYFGLGNYTEAVAKFRTVLGYEWSNKKDDSQLMIARSLALSGDVAQAKEEYQRLIDVYPASPYLEYARARLALL
jgi:TolA-binding protein